MRVEVRYALAFTLAAVAIVAGFWPTFYADVTQNEPVRTVHGFIASAWLIALVVQPWLIVGRRHGAHRLLGRMVAVGFLVFVGSILASIVRMLSEPKGTGDALLARQAVGFADLIALPLLLGLFALAIRAARVRRIADHRRYLACLVAVIVPTGLARLVTAITGHFSPVNIVATEAAMLTLIIVVAIRDRRRSGIWFKPYWVVVAATIGPLLALPLAIDSAPWLAVIRPLGYPG